MPHYIFFLGRHPALAASECWAVLQRYNLSAEILEADQYSLTVKIKEALPPSLLAQLGGTDRIGEVVGEWANWPTAEQILAVWPALPPKWRLGLASSVPGQNIKKLAIEIKQLARGRSSRLKFILAAPGAARLNAAQVLFNSLYKEPNADLTIKPANGKFQLVRTRQVQDIQQYELRDTLRPARSQKVGMLPPKLAQIILNLALAAAPTTTNTVTILDPFCGMGTVLQEGWLMGHRMIGSDINEEMINASTTNLAWLQQNFSLDPLLAPRLYTHDATQTFSQPARESVDAVVTEPFLGPPLHSPLSRRHWEDTVNQLSRLYIAFFAKVRPVLKPGGVILFLLPTVRLAGSAPAVFTPLPPSLLDAIGKTGYSLKHLPLEDMARHYKATERGTLIYARPDAQVAREITLWEKV